MLRRIAGGEAAFPVADISLVRTDLVLNCWKYGAEQDVTKINKLEKLEKIRPVESSDGTLSLRPNSPCYGAHS